MRRGFGIAVATAFSLFAVALSIWDIDEDIAEAFPRAEPILPYVPYLAIALLLLLALFGLSRLGMAALYWVSNMRPSQLQNVSSCACREEDLEAVCNIAAMSIPGVLDLQKTQALYAHNPKFIHKVFDTQDHRIIGYFCVLPLTKKGVGKVKERDLMGDGMQVSYFTKRFAKKATVYIGGVAGIGNYVKAGAYEQLKQFLEKQNVYEAYTRPTTKDGVRLARQNKFEPVSGQDKLVAGVYAYKRR